MYSALYDIDSRSRTGKCHSYLSSRIYADYLQLRRLAEEATVKRNTRYETRGSSYNANDLRQPAKWSIPDAKELDVIVQSLENCVTSIHEQATAQVAVIRDLESSLLKGMCNYLSVTFDR